MVHEGQLISKGPFSVIVCPIFLPVVHKSIELEQDRKIE